MKKQMLNLMLTTAILTTNPLFAMETNLIEDENEGKGIPHAICPSCEPKLISSCQEIEIFEGKGVMANFTNDSIIEVIHALPYNTILNLFSTSKAMNYYCQFPDIWKHIAKKEKIQLNPRFCTIDQVKEFHGPFGNIKKKYTITISELQSFKKEPYPYQSTAQKPLAYMKEQFMGINLEERLHQLCVASVQNASRSFSVGGKSKFQIIHETNPDYLEVLDPNTPITFSWMQDTLYTPFPCFTASMWHMKNPEDARGLKFGSPEYIQFVAGAGNAGKNVYNLFYIRKIEPK